MTDWAAWGTSAGTLVLAGATFAAVRSSNRSARVAERALLAGLRPVLAPSRAHDPSEQVQFNDGRVFEVGAGRALACEQDGVIYLAIPLRNFGAGIAVLAATTSGPTRPTASRTTPAAPHVTAGETAPPDLASFAEQQRDLYVPSGDIGFWQAARRDPGAAGYEILSEAIRTGGRMTVDLLYSDHGGGQATVTRFVLLPGGGERWRCDVTRHWSLSV
jgi:hypothetical protein